ncbi:S24 family peptidase [Paraburkholderia tropica]|uniref:S24 family peptidase n=1 Tax=Paraburkholderia tropica TaxID=92647 RepID=UPI003D2868BA
MDFSGRILYHFDMNTISEIRLANTRALIEMHTLNLTAFANMVGMSIQQMSQVIGSNPTRNIGEQMARRFESALGKPVGWLDQPHEDTADFFPTHLSELAKPSVPVPPTWEVESICELTGLQQEESGDFRVLHNGGSYYVDRKHADRMGMHVDHSAYMVAPAGMEPRIQQGDKVLISYQQNQIASGSIYVLVLAGELILRRVVRRPDGGLRLIADNTDKTRFPDWDIDPTQAGGIKVVARAVGVVGML